MVAMDLTQAALVVGYILAGLVTARAFFLASGRKERTLLAASAIYWPAFALVGAWIVACKIITMPPRRQRLEAKRDRTERQIADLEHELGVGEDA